VACCAECRLWNPVQYACCDFFMRPGVYFIRDAEQCRKWKRIPADHPLHPEAAAAIARIRDAKVN